MERDAIALQILCSILCSNKDIYGAVRNLIDSGQYDHLPVVQRNEAFIIPATAFALADGFIEISNKK